MPEPDHLDAVVCRRADQAWHEYQRVVPFRPGDTPRHAIMSLLDHPHIKHANAQTVLRYAKARELHQTSEKPQVTRSTWPWSVVLDRSVAAV